MALSHPSKSPVKRITIGTHSVPVYWKESEQGWQAKWVEHGEVRRKFSRSLPKLRKAIKAIFVILKPGRGSRVRGGNFHWRYLWVDPDQGKKTGYSMESILVHEITHLCQHHSGRRGDMTDAESEKEAIDCANEYREHEDVGEKLRPYSDHERITEEDIKRWEDEEGEKKKDSCE
ncbi:hypothetical protein N9F73_00200 [bacterium]|nr:hypothetical protein [bacterium]